MHSKCSKCGLGSPPSTPPRTLSWADKAEEEEDDARASPRTEPRAGGRRNPGNRRSA
jgi:hypothetical protein